MATLAGSPSIFAHRGVRWITFGWTAFILENLILSHNREEIIDKFGEEKYHQVYNTLSTAACASIAYGYLKHGRNQGPKLWQVRNPRMQTLAFAFQALGLVGLSQLAPKLQLPVILGGKAEPQKTVTAPQPSEPKEMKVRCPFDFTPPDVPADGIYGIKRVTRHGVFWSLGFAGLGSALGTPFAAEVAMFSGPIVMAAVCGAHIDYRYRRGIGGTLTAEEEAKTSHIPFVALLTGKQSFSSLAPEIKQSNALCAISVAALLHLRRIR